MKSKHKESGVISNLHHLTQMKKSRGDDEIKLIDVWQIENIFVHIVCVYANRFTKLWNEFYFITTFGKIVTQVGGTKVALFTHFIELVSDAMLCRKIFVEFNILFIFKLQSMEMLWKSRKCTKNIAVKFVKWIHSHFFLVMWWAFFSTENLLKSGSFISREKYLSPFENENNNKR